MNKKLTKHNLCDIIYMKGIGIIMKDQILKAIENNAKLTAKDLAAMLGVDEAAVAATIRELEADSVICGYPALINWDKTENERVTALIEVKVTPQRGQGFDKIAERIYRYPEVNSVYLISGGYDLLVTIEGKSLKDVSSFVSYKLSTLEYEYIMIYL